MKELIIAVSFVALAMLGLAIQRIVRGRCFKKACAGKFDETGRRRPCPTCECEKDPPGAPGR